MGLYNTVEQKGQNISNHKTGNFRNYNYFKLKNTKLSFEYIKPSTFQPNRDSGD